MLERGSGRLLTSTGAFLLSCCVVCDNFDKNEEKFQPDDAAKGQSEKQASGSTSSQDISMPERSRLQDFVKDFAKCAVRGVPCEVIDNSTGSVFAAAYFIDPTLQMLQLKRSEASYREIKLADIGEIQDFEASRASGELASPGVPEAVRRALDGGNRLAERLLVIHSGPRVEPVFLLEGSSVDRDRFIMCAKILRLYAQSHSGDP